MNRALISLLLILLATFGVSGQADLDGLSAATSIAVGPLAGLQDELRMGSPVEVGGALVYGLYKDAWPDAAYLTLDTAAENGWIELRELENAEVNQIEVAWDLPGSVLILAGQMIRGAQQDRVFSRDVLLEGRGSAPLPVYCVESGRWSGGSEFAFSGTLVGNAVRGTVNDQRDQSAVWSKVAEEQAKAGVSSESDAYRAVLEDKTIIETRGELSKALDELAAEEGACGLLVIGDGMLIGIDVFLNPALFASHTSELAAAYAPQIAGLSEDVVVHPEPGKLAAGYLRELSGLEVRGLTDRPADYGDFLVVDGTLSGGMLLDEGHILHVFLGPNLPEDVSPPPDLGFEQRMEEG
ncbi:MAG: hypothetical protein GF403_06955 [Candidatus Coatesbacteria bacterium]|nr:hypothetical protein [Candidatus Coatesbacteria bacterium]